MYVESASAPFSLLSEFFSSFFYIITFGFYHCFRRDVNIGLQRKIVRRSFGCVASDSFPLFEIRWECKRGCVQASKRMSLSCHKLSQIVFSESISNAQTKELYTYYKSCTPLIHGHKPTLTMLCWYSHSE